jgi:beta-glucanase (GH16 family)
MGQTGDWVMKFDDEFDGNTLDSSKWRTCFWWADTTCTIESNNEMQLYNPEDVLVENGMLRLRAQKRDMVAWNGVTYHYTSGMVMTGGRGGQVPPSFTFVYGFAEALVKITAGQGLWPAFWTLSADYTWPPEIDIMEILGHEPDIYHMNYHYTGGDDGSTWVGPDFSTGWHVLGLEWRPDAIIWYVDGVERWRFSNAAEIISEPSYLLLNLAVGGDWPGPPDENTPFPSYYDIDYVRVWQRP